MDVKEQFKPIKENWKLAVGIVLMTIGTWYELQAFSEIKNENLSPAGEYAVEGGILLGIGTAFLLNHKRNQERIREQIIVSENTTTPSQEEK